MLELTVESLDKVDEKHRDLYEQKDGKFSLKVSGVEDTGALKRAKDHEKELRQTAEKQAKAEKEAREAAEKKIEELTGKKHKDNGDIEALEKSWQEKNGKLAAEKDGEISKRDAWLKDLTVNAAAQGLAAELAVEGSSKALLPHIQARLAMEMRDGKPVAVVLGADGKPSALTIAELKQEFINDAAFAPLIVGSKASGASSNKGKGGGATGSSDLAKMSPADKAKYITDHGLEAFSKLVAGEKA